MIKPSWLDRKIGYIVGSLVIVLGVVAPSAFPMMVSAASLTSRSIDMTSSVNSATGVTYDLSTTINTAIAASGGVVVQFCDSGSTPLIGLSCTAPAGLSDSAVTLATGTDPVTGKTYSAGTVSATSASVLTWTATSALSSGATLDIGFQNITNPSTVGAFYARITTYASSGNLSTYSSATSVGTTADSGGIALSTTAGLSVTAYVEESLDFCASGATITGSCTDDAANLTSPSMTLGQTVGTVKVLQSSAVSTGTDYTALSTNAANGAVVYLHSNATGCGGLVRPDEAANCDIGPQNVAGNTIAAGQALFGLEEGPAVSSADSSKSETSVGTLTASTNYSSSKYYLNFVSGDATGVTSTYGAPLYNTGNAPVDYESMPMTFGVSAAPATPAGIYSANLDLVAVGTF